MHATLLLLTACANADPVDADALLRQDLHTAAEALTASADPKQAAAAQVWIDLQAARVAIHEAALAMLQDSIVEALQRDHVAKAAGLLSSALMATPDEPALTVLLRDVELAVAEAPPEDQAEAWKLLAEVCRDDKQLTRYRYRAEQASIRTRYSEHRRPLTRSSQQGITRDAAVHLLGRIDAEYYTDPAWSSATYGGAQQLGWLAELGVADADRGPKSHRDPVKALDAALIWGTEAGLSPETTIDEWMRGVLSSLDQWTRAVWPKEMASWQQHHAGVRYGVGLELEKGPLGDVRVAVPIPDTSAWEANLHQYDRVDRIDDLVLAEVEGDKVAAAEAALKGPEGSTVTLIVDRAKVDPWEVTLTRGPVYTPTVFGLGRNDDNSWNPWIDPQDGIAYVRIEEFKPTTLAAFDALLEPHLGEIEAVVVDLRGNAGGDVESAVGIADRFIAQGTLLEISGRAMPETTPAIDPATGEELPDWNEAVKGDGLEGIPAVVLVDSKTASSAELLAGALQQQAGAWVVGSLTWGKGRTQALREEPDHGYAVQYTNLLWMLPGGKPLARDLGGGIQPDVKLELTVGEAYLVRGLADASVALRSHADGTPMKVKPPKRSLGLPDLDTDPGLTAAEITMRALLAPQP